MDRAEEDIDWCHISFLATKSLLGTMSEAGEHLRVLRKGLRAAICNGNEFGKSLAQSIFFTPHGLTALEE